MLEGIGLLFEIPAVVPDGIEGPKDVEMAPDEPNGESDQMMVDGDGGGKGCRCGGTDHLRTSSQRCPLYSKPQRLKEKENPEAEEVMVAVTIGLQTILLEKSIKGPIIDAVDRITRLQVEVSRAVNCFVVWCLEQEYEVPDLRYGSGLMRGFYSELLCSNPLEPFKRKSFTKNAILKEFMVQYAQFRGSDLAYHDGQYLGQLISSAAKLYSTNCQNHIVCNLEKWLKQWCKFSGWFHCLEATKPVNSMNLNKFPFHAYSELTEEDKFFVFGGILMIIEKARRMLGGLSLEEKYMKKNWWRYFYCLKKILQTFTKHNNDENVNLTPEAPGRRLRLFSFLPVNNYTQKHIMIDTDALHDLLKQSNVANNLPNKALFRTFASYWWYKVFDIGNVTTKYKRFAYSITCNGLKVSVHLLKPAVTSLLNDYGYDDNDKYHPLVIGEKTRVVSLDPGRKSLFTANWGDEKKDNFECTTKHWREISGATFSAKQTASWTSMNPEFRLVQSTFPTASCFNMESFLLHMLIFFEHAGALLDFYSEMKWRRLRWKTRIKRQKAYASLAKTLAGSSKDVFIAYGGASFNPCSRGNPPTPNKHMFKELKKRFRARLVNEHNTSKLCSFCLHELKQTKFWAVKVCNSDGLTVWNRDINAARNIRHVFLDLNANKGKRPLAFCRKNRA